MTLSSVATAFSFGAGSLLCATLILVGTHGTGVFGFDFRGTLWEPAKAILDGHSPYPPATRSAISHGNPAVYPPAVMLAAVPLRVLPWTAAVTIWFVLSLLSVAVALRLLGVRDWRVYVVVLASAPLVWNLVFGNLTAMLPLGLAAAWRWRDRPRIAGLAVAAVVVAKLFLLPVLVWLLWTRRFKATAWAVAFGVLGAIGSWAIIGFRGFTSYPSLLRAVDSYYARRSVSPVALLVEIGLSDTAAKILAVLLGLAVLAVGAVLASRADGDRRMFSAAVIAAVVISPIVWIFYFVLLFIPLAIYQPSLSRVWWIASGSWLVVFLGATTMDKAPGGRPETMPKLVWRTLHTRPSPVLLLGCAVLCVATALVTLIDRPPQPKAAANRT